jgi:hypothetical protein
LQEALEELRERAAGGAGFGRAAQTMRALDFFLRFRATVLAFATGAMSNLTVARLLVHGRHLVF